ncbi:MAG: 3-hydroxyacyl-CoA dehydrogenase family protein [Patulibacter sp.]
MAEKLGIAGSGTIATGLAAVASISGEVVLWARSDASAERATTAIEKAASRLEGADASRVTVTTDQSQLGSATYLVEAVSEDYEVKTPLLQTLAELAGPDAILSTTTSSLSIEKLAELSGLGERFVGLHVFNPVPLMKLVEVIFPAEATEATKQRTRALVEALGKTGVEVPDTPGFVVNRLLFPYLFDAVKLMQETGLDAKAIDTCMKLGAGHPMGPLALLDLVGLDVSKAIGEMISTEIPSLVDEKIAAGELGRKTGSGMYPPRD